MKTNILFWQHLAQFFLERGTIQTRAAEKIKTHVLCSIPFFFFENRAIYEIMCKNTVEPHRPETTIRRMRFACWITKATNTHSQYAMLIVFPLWQWLLGFTYIACRVGIRTRPFHVLVIPTQNWNISNSLRMANASRKMYFLTLLGNINGG